MSDDTIDDKKGKNMYTQISECLKSVGKVIAFVLIYTVLSGYTLYLCKVSQSNILPTETNCSPYDENKPYIEEVLCNIFTTYTDPPLSNKISIPYDEYNEKNRFVDYLQYLKNLPNSSFILNYFISILESLISFNYWTMNTAFNFLNSSYEPIIILLGPILLLLVIIIMLITSHFYFMYLWFAQMGWFFKVNYNAGTNSKPSWGDINVVINTSKVVISLIIVVIFILIFCFAIGITIVVPLITIIWTVFSSFGYRFKMNGKTHSSTKIVQELFTFYKVTIMTILGILITITSLLHLDIEFGLVSCVVLILIYMNVVKIGMFTKVETKHLSKLVSTDQAVKTCTAAAKETKTVSGLMRGIF